MNYFLIASPLQYLLAYEIHQQHCQDAKFFIITNYQKSFEQLELLRTTFRVENVHYAFGVKKSFSRLAYLKDLVYQRYWMRKFVENLRHGDQVFIGNVANPIMYPLLKEKLPQVRLFDDGTSTISFMERRHTGETEYTYSKTQGRYSLLQRVKKVSIPYLTYYSIFPKVQGGKNDTVHLYQLTNLANRRESSSCKTNKEVWFVGSTLAEMQLVTPSDYGSVLEQIRNSYVKAGYDFVYIPHRTEKIEKIPDSVKIKVLDVPFEIELIQSKEHPELILSFSSTVIITTELLFRTAIKTAFLKILPYNSKGIAFTDSIYRYACSIGIKVIEDIHDLVKR